jgi:hypothetical protein
MMTRLAGTALLALAITGLGVTSATADDNIRSSPPDTTHYSRSLIPEDLDPLNSGRAPASSARRPGWRKPATTLTRKPDHPKPEGN